MKNILTIFIFTCTCLISQGQPSLSSFNSNQQLQLKAYVKYVDDLSAASLKTQLAEANRKSDSALLAFKNLKSYSTFEIGKANRRADSLELLQKRDSSDLVTLKQQVGNLIKDVDQYTLIEVQKLTPEEQAAFLLFIDKIKNLALLLNGKQP